MKCYSLTKVEEKHEVLVKLLTTFVLRSHEVVTEHKSVVNS